MSGCGKRMSNRAVYLGDGVWWQLTEQQVASGRFDSMPQRIRELGK